MRGLADVVAVFAVVFVVVFVAGLAIGFLVCAETDIVAAIRNGSTKILRIIIIVLFKM